MMPFTHNWQRTIRRITFWNITAALAENRHVGSESAHPWRSRFGTRDSWSQLLPATRWGSAKISVAAAQVIEAKRRHQAQDQVHLCREV